MESDEIRKRLTDEGEEFTDNVFEAIYIFPNGDMMSGDFNSGIRGTDHRAIEILFEDIDRYDDDFWDEVFRRTGAIMVMP